ncbi:MAG: tRNA pseudouridine(55) synthase TruB [Halanaerobiales bacterium]|nr:tRNA pseudouridine(55) synthase TruB [Halanaerobiales bacterium]
MSKQSGILNILKPPGMTSFDVVSYLKKLLKLKKCGHTGTLDPAASGVLPICINRGTKIITYLLEKEKEYIAKIKFGILTDTLDRAGEVVKKDDSWKQLTDQKIYKATEQFRGKIKQKPPIYSAVKVNGKRLYDYARKNQNVNIKKREVVIYDLEILDIKLPYLKLLIRCSKGTYIRSIARDLGIKLNTTAHMTNLIRTASDSFKLADTVQLDQIDLDSISNYLIPIDSPFDYRSLVVKDYAYKYAVNGTKLVEKNFKNWPDDLYLDQKLLIYCKRQFISISKVKEDDDHNKYIQALRVFNNGGS